jgi:hypothetical protein
MTALYQAATVKRSETPTIIRGGSLDPVWPFRFTPFPRGETRNGSRAILSLRPRASELKRTGKIEHAEAIREDYTKAEASERLI